ncbi:Probable Zinc-ribbon domain-containing protein [Paenibacillus sp. yr247]|nr:Probable Zinc-ribbon domain-containing protein [Paenibacillus sp. yr247]
MVQLAKPQFRSMKNFNSDIEVDEIHKLNLNLKRKVRIISGYKKANDSKMGLLTRYPYLKLYWDYEKNIGLNPKYIFPRSEIYVWWTCRLNHSVRMKVKSRVRFVDCRICEKMITPINGSLLELYPHIAKEWDYEKNYPLLPTAIKPKRRENVWWLCSEKQHSYFASPDNRVGKGSGCKRCASSRPRKRRR